MDYNDLNSLLGDLEVVQKNNTAGKPPNFVENEYMISEQFTDKSVSPKIKSRTQIQNLTLNRNEELNTFSNGNFNFEYENPQRSRNINVYNKEQNYSKKKSEHSVDTTNFHLNRNLMVNDIKPRHVNVMDYSQFSENYKLYKNNIGKDTDNDKDNMNSKLSSRESVPNLSSVLGSFWEK